MSETTKGAAKPARIAGLDRGLVDLGTVTINNMRWADAAWSLQVSECYVKVEGSVVFEGSWLGGAISGRASVVAVQNKRTGLGLIHPLRITYEADFDHLDGLPATEQTMDLYRDDQEVLRRALVAAVQRELGKEDVSARLFEAVGEWVAGRGIG